MSDHEMLFVKMGCTVGDKRPVSNLGHQMGEAMPKMSSKVTMKIEPKLLHTIQVRAEGEGLAVSSYIRKAVINYIGERQEDDPRVIRFEMTPLEFRAVYKLIGLGVVRKKEDAFHNAFDSYLRGEYDNVISRAKEMLIEDHLSRGPDKEKTPAADKRSDLSEEADLQLVSDEGDSD